MASDVEVLRLWLQSFETHPSSMPVLFPSMEQLSALSSAIVALEALEAQPKVEGRRAEVVRLLRYLAPFIDCDLHEGCYLAVQEAADMLESEAALSERVVTLETVLRRLDEGLDAAGVDPYCEGETTARDIIRETGAVPSRSFLALSSPSKPETP